MSASQIAGVAVSLGDDPAEIQAVIQEGAFGDFGRLQVGQRLTVHISGSTPEVLRALAAAATELADWQERQQTAQIGAAA